MTTQTLRQTDYHLKPLTETIDEFLLKNYSKNPSCLEEAISNELVAQGMKRINESIVDLTRKVNFSLAKNQTRGLLDFYGEEVRGVKNFSLDLNKDNLSCSGLVPTFSRALISEKELTYESIAEFLIRDCSFFKRIRYAVSKNIVTKEGLQDGPGYFCGETDESGTGNLTMIFNWTAPFKADVSVAVPQIPKEIIWLGEDSITEYYLISKKLRNKFKRGSEKNPSLCVLWPPSDEDYRITSKVAKAEPPIPKRDPALYLTISGPEKTVYRNLIAIWQGENENFELLKKYLQD